MSIARAGKVIATWSGAQPASGKRSNSAPLRRTNFADSENQLSQQVRHPTRPKSRSKTAKSSPGRRPSWYSPLVSVVLRYVPTWRPARSTRKVELWNVPASVRSRTFIAM